MKRKGFTLIELLVVVLILSIFMAVALPLYFSAVADSQKKVCRTNQTTIAEAAKKQASLPGSNGVLSLTGLKDMPPCPGGGTYSLEDGGVVKCSIKEHNIP